MGWITDSYVDRPSNNGKDYGNYACYIFSMSDRNACQQVKDKDKRMGRLG